MSHRIVQEKEDLHGDQDSEAGRCAHAVTIGRSWRKRNKHRTHHCLLRFDMLPPLGCYAILPFCLSSQPLSKAWQSVRRCNPRCNGSVSVARVPGSAPAPATSLCGQLSTRGHRGLLPQGVTSLSEYQAPLPNRRSEVPSHEHGRTISLS